jgi:ribosomal protein S18 acetylase RimI-like enzyme
MIAFRNAGIIDIPAIQKIAYETWPHTFGSVLPRKQISYMLDLIYNEDSLKKQMLEKGQRFILAEKEDKPTGFTSYEINYNNEPQLMIHKIYLLPSTQGTGTGTKLLNLLTETALQNNNDRLRLKVYFENHKAIGFYEKYGFQNMGTESTDIGNDYIILDNVMVKELSQARP